MSALAPGRILLGCGIIASALAGAEPAEITDAAGLRLVRIPAGEFVMGSPTTEKGRRADEPQRPVRITRDFWICRHEVTRGQFRRFVEATGYKTDAERGIRGGYGVDETTGRLLGPDKKFSWRFTGFPQTDEHPVVNVSWNDAGAFCTWLAGLEKQAYRLPTEAEWEYACRGGTAMAYCNGDDAEKIIEVGNIMDALGKAKYPDRVAISAQDGHVFTAPVGSFRPNAIGLHDMHGNVWEWCADWFGTPPMTPQTDPRGPDAGKDKVVRGGDWYHDASFARSAQRSPIHPSLCRRHAGFRVVREAASPTTAANPGNPLLLPGNVQAPFCYVIGGQRRWPVLANPLPEGAVAEFVARRGGAVLARGAKLNLEGLSIALADGAWLEVVSAGNATRAPLALELELIVRVGITASTTQRLELRPAPPPRPISYYADFGDDLIHLFMDSRSGRWRPLEKSGFDQYFRRLQAHGVTRLIVWQSPFPYMADPANYAAEDWERHARQARAIIEDEAFERALDQRGRYAPWHWLRRLLALRLSPEFGELLTRSAAEHGIALTASFRPFEAALSKYYEVPAFDAAGAFLWSFHPLASPDLDARPEDSGFAHYRTLLAGMGHPGKAELATIRISGAANAAAFHRRFAAKGDNLRIVAADFPPLQDDSFVLVRDSEGRFRLQAFREIRQRAEAHRHQVTGFDVTLDGEAAISVSGLRVPSKFRYLILSNPSDGEEALDLDAQRPVALWSRERNRLGRENLWWVAPESDGAARGTRVGGITADGDAWSVFQASQASADATARGPKRRLLRDEQLVIDLGEPWSVEMIDFNQSAARRRVVAELRSLLGRPPFDEIFINTRSHAQLAAHFGDGADGIQPIGVYRAAKEDHVHLGADLAFAPRSAGRLPSLRALTGDLRGIEKITMWQPGEWKGTCQAPDGAFPWRYARNHEVAAGVRHLLADLEQAFPKTRIRVVLPESAAATERVKSALDQMPKPGGGAYGREYYRHLWASINHIPAIGEGMSLVDLTGLNVEPVFLGIRFLPDMEPFQLFVRECIADMEGNRGSTYRGPRSFFYEGHETLRATDRDAARRGREERICHLLSQAGAIREVILYEAAAWVEMPLSDPDLCGHGFLDRCPSLGQPPSPSR